MRRALGRWWGCMAAVLGMALGGPAAAQAPAPVPVPVQQARMQAQPGPVHGRGLAYVVSPGESLSDIGHRLLGGPDAWKRLQRWNGLADPHLLRPGQRLVVPLAALRGRVSHSTVLQVQGSPRSVPASRAAAGTGHACSEAAQRGSGATSTGRSSARGGEGGEVVAAALQVGQLLAEGSCIDTAERESLALELPDGSRLQVFAGTRLHLARTQRWGPDHRRWVELRLERGRAEAQARGAPGLLRIGTPLGTAAVRGTTFGVEVQPGRVLVDVSEGVVDVWPAHTRERAPVQAGQGAALVPGQGVRVAALLPPPPVAPQEQAQTLVLRDSRGAPVLRFGTVDAAAGYRFVVTQNAAQDAMAARVIAQGDAAAPAVPLAALQEGAYAVQLRALGADGLPGQAAQRPVQLVEVPDPPVLQSPPEGATVPYGPLVLRCSPAPTGRMAEEFEFELARDPGFVHGLLVQRSERCALETAVPGGTVYWRVRALGAPRGGVARSGAYSPAGVMHAETEVSAPLPTGAPGPAADDAPAPGRR